MPLELTGPIIHQEPETIDACRAALRRLVTLDQTIRMRIGPLMATVMLECNSRNRPFKPAAIKSYAKQMAAGTFYDTGEAVIFNASGALNDGQNRLMAVIRSGATIVTDVRFGVSADIKVLGATDTGKIRTGADTFFIDGQTNNTNLSAVVDLAIRYERGDKNFSETITNGDRLDFVEANPDVVDAAHKGGAYHRHFRSIPPRAYGFCFFLCARRSPADAEIFFDRFATGIGIDRRDDPAHALRQYIINFASRTEGHGVRRDIRLYIAAIFKAWNVERDGKRLGNLRLVLTGEKREDFPWPK